MAVTEADKVLSSPLPDDLDTNRIKGNSIEKVREIFTDHFNKNRNLYDEIDCDKVFKKDYFIERCLHWKKYDIDSSSEMLKKCFQWRKTFGLTTRTDLDFPSEFFQAGGIFEYQPDKNGYPTLYMRVKMIKKVKDLDKPLEEFIVHQINKLDTKQAAIRSYVLVFDCTDIGWSNVHLDMLRFIINTMVNYFTWGIRYILVVDVPWLLNAAQKLVFTMLPEEAKRIVIFKKRHELTKLIDESNLPTYLGGKCEIDFRAVPNGCQSLEVMGVERYGYSTKQITKLKEYYEQVIDFKAE